MAQKYAPSQHEMTPEEMAEGVKNVARNITEYSIKVREIVKAMRQTGAMVQLTEAFREAVITSRDTAKAINDTATELQRSGVIRETASAIMETAESAHMTYETVKSSAMPESQRKSPGIGVKEGIAQ